MLFSEPKIPQYRRGRAVLAGTPKFQCSSASRKFLNRTAAASPAPHHSAFQCSSASRKFLNTPAPLVLALAVEVSVLFSEPKIPQSRVRAAIWCTKTRFSALQRAENSSMRLDRLLRPAPNAVSVLFSEPKIPQLSVCAALVVEHQMFQCSSASRKFLNRRAVDPRHRQLQRFSALQRAENSSIRQRCRRRWR